MSRLTKYQVKKIVNGLPPKTVEDVFIKLMTNNSQLFLSFLSELKKGGRDLGGYKINIINKTKTDLFY